MSAVKWDIDVHRILQCIGIRLLVIPVGCNIQCACRNRDAVYLLDFLLKPVGQELSSRFDPEEYEPLCPFIPLQYLMGYARQRSCDLCFIQNRPLFISLVSYPIFCNKKILMSKDMSIHVSKKPAVRPAGRLHPSIS